MTLVEKISSTESKAGRRGGPWEGGNESRFEAVRNDRFSLEEWLVDDELDEEAEVDAEKRRCKSRVDIR